MWFSLLMLFLIAILEYMAQRKEPVEKEKWKIGEGGIIGGTWLQRSWGGAEGVGGGRGEGVKTQVKLSVLD